MFYLAIGSLYARNIRSFLNLYLLKWSSPSPKGKQLVSKGLFGQAATVA